MLNVVVPSFPVACSGGVVVTTGVERRKTSAPRTATPLVVVTRTRTLVRWVSDVILFGLNVTCEITSRSGRLTLSIGTEVPGPGGGAGPAAVTAAVGFEVAFAVPAVFRAVTRTRRRRPRSAAATTYVFAVAPAMAFALVYTAEHYLVDILLGWAYTLVAVWAVSRLTDRRARWADDSATTT